MERDAEWMIDDVGHEQGGCCLAMTLRDYGRFGQFILDGARIDGQPVVADHWLAEATRTQVSTGGTAPATAISGGPATMAPSRAGGSTARRCTSIGPPSRHRASTARPRRRRIATRARRGRTSSPL